MRARLRTLGIALAGGVALSLAASAGHALSLSGDVTLYGGVPPVDLAQGAIESNIAILFGPENNSLTSTLTGPSFLPGTYYGDGLGTTFTATGPTGTLPIGTPYKYWIFSFDPVGTPSQVIGARGSITFDEQIIYLSDRARYMQGGNLDIYGGLEGGDAVTLGTNLRTLDFNIIAGPSVDQFVIVTGSPVPVPSTILLLGSGLAGLLAWGRRKKK